jgi:cbb3-type cytochrome c oxidase subunit II
MRSVKTIALIAGAGFFFLAVFIQGIIPYLFKEIRVQKVTKVVRTSLGTLQELKADPLPYDGVIEKGRRIYIREGCWYCHSMYIRPLQSEVIRWGPISEFGEYSYDLPHLFGTRRIGPDLTRIGGKYGDDWHIAHFFNPRMIVPDSIMPRFTWFFKKDTNGRYVLNDDGKAILAFIQSRGLSKGRWRDEFPYQTFLQGSSSVQSRLSVENGKMVYLRRCAGCHGEKGDGKGEASNFFAIKPRDFTSGTYKFRSTPSGSLPLDGDLYRTVSAGIRGTAMPAWYVLSEQERWDVINYIKSFYPDFKTTPPEQPIFIPQPPSPTEEMVKKGRRVFEELKCWECHGSEGRGDGEKANTLKDDWDNPIKPTDFTKGIFKSGSRPEDLYRTIMTGLNGTPMPSYIDSIQAMNEDPWALVYYILSLSADKP